MATREELRAELASLGEAVLHERLARWNVVGTTEKGRVEVELTGETGLAERLMLMVVGDLKRLEAAA
jgi:hypothetical protein